MEEDAAADAPLTLLSLPLPLVLLIFSLLPVDCRLRCAEVCRGWRGVLAERSLWTRLDVSRASGVRMVREMEGSLDALCRCAAARAAGGLHSLHVDAHLVSQAVLRDVAAASAGALCELRVHGDEPYQWLTPDEVGVLCDAAPRLRFFGTDLNVDAADAQAARAALRNEAPFGPLRVRRLFAYLRDADAAGVVAFAADVAAHASLCELVLLLASLDAPAALDAVVDAALARRLHSISFSHCRLSPASAPALARLLRSDTLTSLSIEGDGLVLLDAAAAAVLAAALRANATLTALSLRVVGVFSEFSDPAVATELLGALTGHASLRSLDLEHDRVFDAHRAAAGALFGALVAANAPSLTQLNVAYCDLGDDGLSPLFDALRVNSHLRTLKCGGYGIMSEAFAADALLPAVRANASLRCLEVLDEGEAAGVLEAAALVAQRPSIE
jgi:hypothetical protein